MRPPRSECATCLQDEESYRKDQVSHHILRLAYCQSEDKRRFFLQQEVVLFKMRLERQTPEQVAFFMSRHGLTFTPVRAPAFGPRGLFILPLRV